MVEEDIIEKALEKSMSKQNKKSKTRRKPNPHWSKVWQQLRDEDMKKNGYV